MPGKCCIPNCNTGYDSNLKENATKECHTIFSTSNKELLAKWSKAVPRQDYVFTKYSKVCIKHFEDSDVLKGFTHYVGGKPIYTPYKRLRLKPDAVPSIFPNCPAYLSKKARKRKSPTERCDVPPPTKVKQSRQDTILTPISTIIPEKSATTEDTIQEITETTAETTIEENTETTAETMIEENTETTIEECNTDWGMELKKISFPQMWTYQQMGEQLFSFFQTNNVDGKITVVKGMTLKQNSLTYCIYGETFAPKDLPKSVATVPELKQVIETFENAKMCKGVSISKNRKITQKLLLSDTCFRMQSRNWKSYQCENILNSTVKDNPNAKQRCGFCDKLKAYVTKLLWKEKNQSTGKIAKCRMVIKNSKKVLARRLTKLQSLRSEIASLQTW